MTVNSARYVAMIRDFLVTTLRRRRLNRFRIWFQQEGATAHTSREAMAELRRLFLGSSSPIEVMCRGPPALRTCQLAIILWGYLKGKVYVDKPQDIPQLKNSIESELRAIPRRMCEQVFTNFSLRLNECVKYQGRHLTHWHITFYNTRRTYTY